MTVQPWEEFLASLGPLGGVVELDEASAATLKAFADRLRNLPVVSQRSLAQIVVADPDTIPLLGLTVRLSQEQLRNVLRHRFGTPSWRKLGRENPADVVGLLDNEHGLIAAIELERNRQWEYADILAERYASRLKARGASKRGRNLENVVEDVVARLGLPRSMRTRFVGQGNQTAPCDLAIPGGSNEAQIVVAIKGFDSSGSKLTDATREIQAMAMIRRPTQYLFVILDGIGWISRQADLRRIHTLWAEGSIEGVYTSRGLDAFRDALIDAARHRNLLNGG